MFVKNNVAEKSSFIKEKFKPYFMKTFNKSVEIFALLKQHEPALILHNDLTEEFILTLYHTQPLLQKCWKLACIPDNDERIRQTYQAVLEARGLNPSPEVEAEISRLSTVKDIFS
jgi:hypothetical protein